MASIRINPLFPFRWLIPAFIFLVTLVFPIAFPTTITVATRMVFLLMMPENAVVKSSTPVSTRIATQVMAVTPYVAFCSKNMMIIKISTPTTIYRFIFSIVSLPPIFSFVIFHHIHTLISFICRYQIPPSHYYHVV